MSVLVRIPTPLRSLTKGQAEVKAEGGSIGELIERLDAKYAGLKDRLCEGDGKIRRFINIYVNEEDIRFLQGPATPLKTGDAVSIVPAIAGGAITVTMSGSWRRRRPGPRPPEGTLPWFPPPAKGRRDPPPLRGPSGGIRRHPDVLSSN